MTSVRKSARKSGRKSVRMSGRSTRGHALKTSKIVIFINGRRQPADAKNWISITPKLLYLSWSGRLYTNSPAATFNDDELDMKFTYSGPWETAGKTVRVVKKCRVVFESAAEYLKAKQMLEK